MENFYMITVEDSLMISNNIIFLDPGLFQGDMILSPGQLQMIQNETLEYAITSTKEFQYWPIGKPISYEITSSIG